MEYDFYHKILEPSQNQIFQIMKDKVNREKAVDEIVKIIQDFQYNDELSEKYKREILDQDKIYDQLPNYVVMITDYILCPHKKVQLLLNNA